MPTQKHSVLISYKYLEYIESADLSDADSWILMRSVIEYDRSGAKPSYLNPVLYGLFAVIKVDLDKRREAYEEACTAKREAGKMGGAPKGNKNAAKKREGGAKQPKQPDACFSPKNKQKQHGSDLDSDLDLESGGGKSPPKTTPKNGAEKPPPLYLDVKNNLLVRGLVLDDADIRALVSATDPSWFGKHSFVDFVAETVLARRGYAEKPRAEKHALFRFLLFGAGNLREEFPRWRAEREGENKEAARKAGIERARGSPPTECKCGGRLDRRLLCESCKGFFEFNAETAGYDFVPMVADESPSGGFNFYKGGRIPDGFKGRAVQTYARHNGVFDKAACVAETAV